jgi:adenosine deaminase
MTHNQNAIPDRYTGPTAELHVHLEGTITAAACHELAKKNNVDLPTDLFRPSERGLAYNWRDFHDLVVRVYDIVAQTCRTAKDYELVTYYYLKSLAEENRCIYSEITISPDHARSVGLSYERMVNAVVKGAKKAQKDYGIVCRFNATLVRHLPLSNINRTVQDIIDYPHPYVRGFDLAGIEKHHDITALGSHLRTLIEAGLKPRVHAAEQTNGGIMEALDLGCSRIGHGVQAIKHDVLVNRLGQMQTMLELSLHSNNLSGACPLMEHPIRDFYERGIPICLNSDDPGLFNTTLLDEYNTAMEFFGFTDFELRMITRNAIMHSFLEEDLKPRRMIKQ